MARAKNRSRDRVDFSLPCGARAETKKLRLAPELSLAGERGRLDQAGAFTASAILSQVPLRLVPASCTAAMMTTAMPAAIRPYSMVVAPDSSQTKRERTFFISLAPENPHVKS